MASHAHDPGDHMSKVKKGGILAASIGAVGSITVAVVNLIGTVDTNSTASKEAAASKEATASTAPTASEGSTWTTFTPTPVSLGSDQGLVDKYAINDSGTEVKVWGHADKDVDGVFVLVGPKPSAAGYWPAFTNVFNQQWEADVATEPQISPGYKIWAIPHTPGGGAPSQSPVKFTFQNDPPTPTPPRPPDPIMNCAAQHGPDCFTGPGWGPPSVYQPNQ
jgi:hypothetical protein